MDSVQTRPDEPLRFALEEEKEVFPKAWVL